MKDISTSATLANVLKVAKEYETAKAACKLPSASSTVDAVKSTRKFGFSQRKSAPSGSKSGFSAHQCYSCGDTAHLKRDCHYKMPHVNRVRRKAIFPHHHSVETISLSLSCLEILLPTHLLRKLQISCLMKLVWTVMWTVMTLFMCLCPSVIAMLRFLPKLLLMEAMCIC